MTSLLSLFWRFVFKCIVDTAGEQFKERVNNQYKLFTKVKRAFIKNLLFHIYKNTFGCVYFQMNYYNMAVFMILIEREDVVNPCLRPRKFSACRCISV